MQILVTRIRHVIVEHNIDSLNVDTSAENVSCNHYPLLEILEQLEAIDSFFLVNTRMDAHAWKTRFEKEFVECVCSRCGLHKDDYLVELQGIEKVN